MNFFAVFLQKLEPSCEIGAYSAAIFRKVPYRKWPPLALSSSVTVLCVIHGYHVYREVWNPSIGEEIVCFAEEENSHRRKAVISTSDDISKHNKLLNFRQVQVLLSSTVPEVFIAIKQYPGVPPLPKLEVLPNFRVAQ